MGAVLIAVTIGIVVSVLTVLFVCIWRKHRISVNVASLRRHQGNFCESASQILTPEDKALRRRLSISKRTSTGLATTSRSSRTDPEARRSKDADMEKSIRCGEQLTGLHVSKEAPAGQLLQPASPEQNFPSTTFATSLTPEPAPARCPNHSDRDSVPVPAQNYQGYYPQNSPTERVKNSIRIRAVDDIDVRACTLRNRDSATRTMTDSSVPSERLPAHLLPKSAGSLDSDFVVTDAAYFTSMVRSPRSMCVLLTSPTASMTASAGRSVPFDENTEQCDFGTQELSLTISPQCAPSQTTFASKSASTKVKGMVNGRAPTLFSLTESRPTSMAVCDDFYIDGRIRRGPRKLYDFIEARRVLKRDRSDRMEQEIRNHNSRRGMPTISCSLSVGICEQQKQRVDTPFSDPQSMY